MVYRCCIGILELTIFRDIKIGKTGSEPEPDKEKLFLTLNLHQIFDIIGVLSPGRNLENQY